jgi:heat shock protein HslJ
VRWPGACLLALAMSGSPASAADAPGQEPVLEGSFWRLLAWNDKPDSKLLRSIDLRFEDGRLGGEGPCNIYNAAYSVEGERLKLGPIGATKRGCEPERTELESAWFEALRSLDRIGFENGRLVLGGPQGLRLVFERGSTNPDES